MQIKEGLEIRNIAGEKVLIMQGRYGVDMTRIASFNPTAEVDAKKWMDKLIQCKALE